MILALGIVGLIWLPAIIVVWCWCRAAAIGDAQAENARRRHGAHRGTWQ